MSPPLRQLALQFAAVMAVLSLAWPYYGIKGEALPWPGVVAVIGITALLLASFSRQPWWWRLIHGAFAPLAWGVSLLEIDPGWFLLAALMLMLVYRGALSGQIPLYLSNRETARTFADLLPKPSGLRCADLGAGLGSMLRPLAATRPDGHFVGVENAPLTWLGGKLLALRHTNCEWRWGDLWRTDLREFDVVYAFLSPVPMAALWCKVEKEMKPGSLFISNSFPVPEIEPSEIVEVDDERQTQLYCYRR